MQQQPEKPGDPLGQLYSLTSVLATCVTVFSRRGFGSEALGFHGIGAFILILFVTAYQPQYEPIPQPPNAGMGVFLCVWFLCLVLQRLGTGIRWWRGEVAHSRYGGYPYMAAALPFVRSEAIAKVVEALAFIPIGMLIRELSPITGGFVMVCGLASLMREGIEHAIRGKRRQRMIDAKLDGDFYASGG